VPGTGPHSPMALRGTGVGGGHPSAPSVQRTRCRPEGQEISKDVKNVLPRRRMLNRLWGRGLGGCWARRGVPRPGGCFPSACIAITSCMERLSSCSPAHVYTDTRAMAGASLPCVRGCNRGEASPVKGHDLLSAAPWLARPARSPYLLRAALAGASAGAAPSPRAPKMRITRSSTTNIS